MTEPKRRYHAPARAARAQETRARILTAARAAFARDGFAATVREIAGAAGVSAATIELQFGTKAALLDAVVDVALAGDDEPVPVLERPWVRELARLSAGDFLDAAAAAFAAGAARAAPVMHAVDQASGRHPELAGLATRLRRQRGVMARWVVDAVVGRDALAADLDLEDATETVLALIDPPLLRRFLLESGWAPDRLGGWLGRSFRRLLLDGED